MLTDREPLIGDSNSVDSKRKLSDPRVVFADIPALPKKAETSAKVVDDYISDRKKFIGGGQSTPTAQVRPYSIGVGASGDNFGVAVYRPNQDSNVTLAGTSQQSIDRDPGFKTPVAISIGTDTKAPAVSFPIFRIPVWRRATDADTQLNELAGGIKDKQIPVGGYVFTFQLPKLGFFAKPIAISSPFPFTASGKQMVMEKALYNPTTGELKMQVTVVENLIPLLIVAGAGAVALGYAAKQFTDSLVAVDKVMMSTGTLVIVGIAGLVAWYALPSMFGRK